MMSLYVSCYYKNSPNDLQLMADAPAHHLFVLLGPVDESKNQLPDILCVIQVCLEGQISRKSAIRSLSDGHQPHGDQIPWKFCEQFRDTVFPTLSGVRIVRIATHPNATRLGYGSAAVELLSRYYEGQLTSISEIDVEDDVEALPVRVLEAAEKVSLLEESIKPRKDLPPLLVHLRERRPEKLHYLGVSFGLTLDLFRFWKKHKFAPFYISQIPNTVTGEHTCMVLKPLDNDDIEVTGSDELGFFTPFYQDFKLKFTRLLGAGFNDMECRLAMSVLDPKIDFTGQESGESTSDDFLKSLNGVLSPYDMERLKAYTENLSDYLAISDLIPVLAHLYFQLKLPVTLSYVQASILFCMGLQNQNISYVEGQLKILGSAQILLQLRKVMMKLHKYLHGIASKEIESTLPRLKERILKPHSISVDEDLNDAARKAEEEMKTKLNDMLEPEFLQEYAIEGREEDLEKALQNGSGNIHAGSVISVKSSKENVEKPRKQQDANKSEKKRRKDDHGSKSGQKRRKP